MSKKVLIVDDERQIVEVIAEYLEFEGYDSCTALNGEEGLRQMEEQHPDLVITDMRMPGMDGYEFSRRIRQAYDIPIIMLTGTIHPSYSGPRSASAQRKDVLKQFFNRSILGPKLLAVDEMG